MCYYISMEKMIVLLDADDTLLDFAKSEREAIITTLEEFSLPVTERIVDRYVKINQHCWKLLETGRITREYLDRLRFDMLFEEFSIEGKDSVAAGAAYRRHLTEKGYVLHGCIEFLTGISKKYRLFLVTNGTESTQIVRLKTAGIDGFFEQKFYSEQIGCAKPYAGFFDYVFSHIKNFDKARTVLVGDSLSSDISGANNAGIIGIWFNPKGLVNDSKAVPDYTVAGYDELLALLTVLSKEKTGV